MTHGAIATPLLMLLFASQQCASTVINRVAHSFDPPVGAAQAEQITRQQVRQLAEHLSTTYSAGQVVLGKGLRPFRSYLDVSITHFQVPDGIDVALFDLTAFLKPNRCARDRDDTRNSTAGRIVVYFQHGSLPVFDEHYSPLPQYILSTRSHLIRLDLEPDNQSHYVKLRSPRPGNWYCAAFIAPDVQPKAKRITSDEFERIRMCHTILSMSLHLAPFTGAVVDIGLSGPGNTISYNDSLNTTIPSRMHRLDISEGFIGTVVIRLANCDACRFRTRAAAMPFDEPDLIISCRANSSACESTLATIEPGRPLYILVELERQVNYTSYLLSVKRVDCPRRNWQQETADSGVNDGFNLQLPTTDNRVTAAGVACPSSVQTLTRIDYGLAFSSRFFIKQSLLPLLQDVLLIPLRYPSTQLLRFEIAPRDIGGTLWLKLLIKPPYISELDWLDLFFCITPHRLPSVANSTAIVCPDGSHPIVQTFAERNFHIWELYVPYPEPGPYYLGILARPRRTPRHSAAHRPSLVPPPGGPGESPPLMAMARDIDPAMEDHLAEQPTSGQLRLKRSAGNPIPANARRPSSGSSVLVLQFHIVLQQCFRSGCNEHGRCRYALKAGSFIFTSCECYNGYRSLDCSDGHDAMTDGEIKTGIVLLVASNALYLPAAAMAWHYGYRLEALVYMTTAFFSAFYHACDRSDSYSFCVVDYDSLQYADFYCGVLSFYLTVVALAHLTPTIRSIAHVAGCIGIALGVQHRRTGTILVYLLPGLAAGSILTFVWLKRFFYDSGCRIGAAADRHDAVVNRHKSDAEKDSVAMAPGSTGLCPTRRYLLLRFLPGSIIAGFGVSLYAVAQTEDNYSAVHSAWHALMALAIMIILPRADDLKSMCAVAGKLEGAPSDEQEVVIAPEEAVGDVDCTIESPRRPAPKVATTTTLCAGDLGETAFGVEPADAADDVSSGNSGESEDGIASDAGPRRRLIGDGQTAVTTHADVSRSTVGLEAFDLVANSIGAVSIDST